MNTKYNPKTNLVEEVFAELDKLMLKNARADAKNGKPWPSKGAGKEKHYRKQIAKAIHQLNKNKTFFKNQYTGYKERCRKFIRSRGKRLKTSRY